MPTHAVFFYQNGFRFRINCYSLSYALFVKSRLEEESWIEKIA